MRSVRSSTSVLVVVMTVLVAASLTGCGARGESKAPAVTSAWPRADSEKVVPKPASPPRWPLTGRDAPSAAAIRRRVVSVKIENSPGARPQTALNSADIVYETLAEGGITRFNVIFHSQNPKLIGPVRSARLSDTWIVPQYDALFFFSGASGFVTRALKKAGVPMLSEDAGVTRCYTRVSSRRSPHNLYLRGDLARQEGVRRGNPATQKLRPFAFERRAAESTVTVTSIDIPFSPHSRSTWTYDPARKVYLRQNNGIAHDDAASGQQVRARNVVVMWARMRSTGVPDKLGNATYDIVLGGKGRVSVFHDGRQWDGTWSADEDSPPVFRTDDGTLIKLAPGNSWLEVIPTNVNISLR